jgi:putative transposase
MPRLLDDPNDPRWLEAERRDIFLRGLLMANDWTATREVVEAVRNEFRIGRSTVYGMIARFRASRKASSLIPAGRGTPDGAKRLEIRTERLIGQQIDRFWLKKEKPKMRALIQRVREACRIEGRSRRRNRSTIRRRVDECDALGAARRRGEVSLEAEVTPSAGRFHAERPNDVWQIDHTIVDLIVVDEETRLPIGRPFLTLAVDR